ncbi:MAG TPA: DUF885 domain-containing protein [Thermoanaerobaculia bacterium]|nr:DUF885 domain-containing protein [Thermoanaerobaculia bacterium]
MRLRALLAFAGLLGLASGGSAADDPAGRVTATADEYVAAFTAQFPEQAVLSGFPLERNDRFSDNSLASLDAWERKEDAWARRIADIREADLRGKPEWVTYGFLREAIEASRGLRVCRNELWPANQMTGWQAWMPDVAAAQPVGTPALREQALARWRSLPRWLDTEIANLREGLQRGYSTPKHNVELVVAQLEGFLSVPPEKSPLASPADRDPAFRKVWIALVAGDLNPAIRKYRNFLETEYLPKAREAIGVSANPDGAACYAASLRSYTSLSITPRQMFEEGERAVAEYEKAARAIGTKLYGVSDLPALREKMKADPKNHFATREELMRFSQAAVDRATAALPRFFGIVPKAKVVIEPIPAFDEEHGVPNYVPASEDGSRPGTYHISLYEPEKQDRALLESTAFHETVPGHHLQLSIAQELPKTHAITRLVGNSGFSEGWAVYAEFVADEMGLYSTDLDRLGLLVGLPTGMVADPGIHVMGWTRQQAIDYFLAKRPDYSPKLAASQADRIAVTPGQLTTYFAGALEFRRLREEAERALGKRFDVRRFHDAVLGEGSITLPMLEERIARWIEQQNVPAAPAGAR